MKTGPVSVCCCLHPGLDDDEESWAAAVIRKRGEQGLLQAHEMVERALGREYVRQSCVLQLQLSCTVAVYHQGKIFEGGLHDMDE